LFYIELIRQKDDTRVFAVGFSVPVFLSGPQSGSGVFVGKREKEG
jgi:hypothetical protein